MSECPFNNRTISAQWDDDVQCHKILKQFLKPIKYSCQPGEALKFNSKKNKSMCATQLNIGSLTKYRRREKAKQTTATKGSSMGQNHTHPQGTQHHGKKAESHWHHKFITWVPLVSLTLALSNLFNCSFLHLLIFGILFLFVLFCFVFCFGLIF